MAQGSGIVWRQPPEVITEGLTRYEERLLAAVGALARYFEPLLENDAKAHAPWTDRTGNARQSLFAVTDEDKRQNLVTLFLSHGVEYGKWLELCNAGQYAIIMETLEIWYPDIMSALEDLVEG